MFPIAIVNFSNLEEKARMKLESDKQRSLKSIPSELGLLLFILVGIWVGEGFIRVPFWLAILLIGTTACTLMVDLINVVACGRKLKKLSEPTR